jgi:DNA-directed RNA polymerase II subunit RPB11
MVVTVTDVDLCVVNAVRRAMISEVPIVAFAFDHDPTQNAVKVLTNTCPLNNEILGERISLIPICLDEKQLRVFDPTHYKFVLKKKNVGLEELPVTSGDFQVFDQTGVRYADAVVRRLFPTDPVTGDHVLLATLRPGATRDADGEELSVECTARLGTGLMHARWSPVSLCFMTNTVDPAAAEEAFRQKLAAFYATEGAPAPSDEVEATVRRRFHSLEALRHFHRDPRTLEPRVFTFTAVSECGLRPTFIFFKALLVLRDKVAAVRDTLVRGPDDADMTSGARLRAAKKVTVESTPNMPDMHVMTIQGEDHTLGNLLQGLLFHQWIQVEASSRVSYVGYTVPHPLEPYLLLKIKSAVPGADVRQLLVDELFSCMSHLEALAAEWASFSGLTELGLEEVAATVRQRSSMAKALAAPAPTPTPAPAEAQAEA